MKKYLFILAAMSLPAIASAQNVTSITAAWTNDSPDAGVQLDNSPGSDIRVCWPRGQTGLDLLNCNDLVSDNDYSGYRFVKTATPIVPTIGTAFSIGDFYHYNRPISGTDLNSVNLELDLVIGGTAISSNWLFNHNETNNTGGGCCNDLISISSLGTSPLTFMFSGTEYSFNVLGFGDTPSDAHTFSYSTVENQVNQTKVWGVINRTAVPEPASLTLVLGGLAGLGYVRRRRNA